MKKIAFFGVAALLTLGSCSTITHTAATQAVDTEIINRSNADLEVSSQKISFTFNPSDSYRRAGDKAVIRAAVAKALEQNGNADILVAPQFEVKKTRGLFGNKVKYVTVKGYPAFYKNVHSTTLQEAQVAGALEGGSTVICNK